MATPFVKAIAAFASLSMLAACSSGQPLPADTGSSPTSATTRPPPVAPLAEGSVSPLADALIAGAKPTGQPCSLDSVDGNYAKQVQLDPAVPHVFRGWILGPTRQPAGKFSIVLVGAHDYALSASTGVTRTDVGDYLKAPALAAAGFAFQVSVKNIPSGTYQAKLVANRAGVDYVCDTEKAIHVN